MRKSINKLFMSFFLICALLFSWHPNLFAQYSTVATRLLSIISEFFTVSLPLLRTGRTAATISANAGKVSMKIDRELKSGVKIGLNIPLTDFQAIARATYISLNGKNPSSEFDEKSGVFVIVVHNNERTVFVTQAETICVANTVEPTLISVSFSSRHIEIPVSTSVTDVMFGSNKSECEAIGRQIDQQKLLQRSTGSANPPIRDPRPPVTHPGCQLGYDEYWLPDGRPGCNRKPLVHPGCAKGFDPYWLATGQPGCRPDHRIQMREYINNFNGCVPTIWGQACGNAAKAELCQRHQVCD
jgi:hypothetical protein